MDEKIEEKAETKEPEEKPGDTGEGNKPQTTSIIDQAIAERQRMEGVLKEIKEENNRTEDIMAKQMLAGRAEGGSGPIKTPEQTDEDYAKRFEAGEVNPLADDNYGIN